MQECRLYYRGFILNAALLSQYEVNTREMRMSSRVLFTYFQFACSYLLTSPRSSVPPALTCVCDHVAVSTLVLLQCEPRQMEPGHYLDWINILPLVNQVICRPAI